MARPVVIGVDVGTGSARALAVDPDGVVVARATAPFPGREGWPAGRADPAGWRTAVQAALGMLHTAAPAALAIGSQSPTTVPRGAGLAITVRHPAGVTGSPVEQHHAQREVLLAEADQSRGVAQLWDWVLAALGADEVQTRWPGDPDLDGYGPRGATGEVVGTADGSWGLPAGTPLVGGAQDAYLAFWAGGTDETGRAVDPGGRTGGLAVAVTRRTRPPSLYALRGAAVGIDLVGGPVAAHGLMLDWLGSLTGQSPDRLTALAADVPAGARGALVLPYLEGERAPRWRRDLRAEIVGLGSEHGPAELARAVLEATAFGLHHIADELRSHGVEISTVVCGGSQARSRTWCQIKADVLEVAVEVPAEPDLAAYGAALAAGAGAGWWPKPGKGAPGSWPHPAVSTLHPRPSDTYRQAYQRFVALGDAAVARLEKETR